MLTRVAEELADLPHLEKVRERLLDEALAFYRQFLEEKGDDSAVRQETVRAYRRVGDILVLLNKHDGAAEAYAHALTLQEPLAAGPDASAAARTELAVLCHNSAGLRMVVQATFDAAKKDFTRSLELRRQLVKELPTHRTPAWPWRRPATRWRVVQGYRAAGRRPYALPRSR